MLKNVTDILCEKEVNKQHEKKDSAESRSVNIH